MEQCNNAFQLLKSELVKMPTLQYPNPNKPFRLFTDASKHNYSGILHQEETSKTPYAGANLIPIAYFSGSFGRRKSVIQSTNPSKNLLFISQLETVHYTVITSH